jgi:uncharacterized protein YcnI
MRRAVSVVGLVLGTLVLMAAPAWAHVTVAPESAPRGATDVQVTFRVPSEEASPTTKIEIGLPTDPPLVGVLAQPVPGWTAKVTTQHLSKPIQTDDGPVSDIVSDVTWTAENAASGVQPDNYQGFNILAGALPDSGDQVVFKAIQTYANGDIVRWVDPVTEGGPEAQHPTPILKLSEQGSTTHSTTPTTVAPAAAATGAVKTAQDDADTAKTVGIIAIVVGGLALIGVVVLLVVRRRGPAST